MIASTKFTTFSILMISLIIACAFANMSYAQDQQPDQPYVNPPMMRAYQHTNGSYISQCCTDKDVLLGTHDCMQTYFVVDGSCHPLYGGCGKLSYKSGKDDKGEYQLTVYRSEDCSENSAKMNMEADKCSNYQLICPTDTTRVQIFHGLVSGAATAGVAFSALLVMVISVVLVL